MSIRRLTHILIFMLALTAIPEAYLQFRCLLATAQHRAQAEWGHFILNLYGEEMKNDMAPCTQAPNVSSVRLSGYSSGKSSVAAISRKIERNTKQSRSRGSQAVASNGPQPDNYLPASRTEKPATLTIDTSNILVVRTFLPENKPDNLLSLPLINTFLKDDAAQVDYYPFTNLSEENEGNAYISLQISDVSSKESEQDDSEALSDNPVAVERPGDFQSDCSSK